MTRLALLPLLLCTFACTQPTSTLSSTPSVEPPIVEPSPAPPRPAVVRPPAPGTGEPGPAYFAIDDVGVVRLDGTSFTILPSPDKYVRDLMIGPDAKLYALTFSDLWQLEGDEFVRVLSFGFDDIGSIDALAFGDQGKIYATSYNGVGEWADGRWTITTKEAIAPEVKLLNGVALGYDGTLWVASSNDLHYLSLGASSWKKSDVSVLDSTPFFNAMQSSPTGDIYAQSGNYLGKIMPGSAAKIEKITFTDTNAWSFNELTFSPDGQIGLGSLSCDLVRVDPAAAGKAWVRNGDSNYGCEGLTAIGLDGQKRMWVASRAGLHVLGPDTQSVAYPSGSVLELVGNLKSIALSGLGPTLPPAGKVRLGKLTGKILMEGTPVAKAKVEICPQPALFQAVPTTPCSGSKAQFSGTTDKQGNFTFSKVPLGNYGIAVEIDGHWRSSWLTDFGTQMKEGQAYDIGAVKISKD